MHVGHAIIPSLAYGSSAFDKASMSFSKRPKPVDDATPAAKRLCANVKDLYASNEVSARRAQSLINDMHSASVKHTPAPAMNLNKNNLARKLRRTMLGATKWAPDYLAKVRVLNRFTEREELQTIAMQLPHEVVAVIHELGDAVKLREEVSMDPESLEHLLRCKASSGIQDMLGFGLHCDGVPHSWDREESCEVFSISFPGLGGAFKNLRIPLFSIPHSSFSENTWDDLMEIIAWSLRFLWQGKNPTQTHKNQPFSETYRKKRAGKDLGLHACLVEVRGDWKMLAETFHLPRWNEKGGICWSCSCTNKEVVCTACRFIHNLNAMRLQPHLQMLSQTHKMFRNPYVVCVRWPMLLEMLTGGQTG